MMDKKLFRQGIFLFLTILVTFFSFSKVEAQEKVDVEKDYLAEVLSTSQKINSLSFNILANINTPIGMLTLHLDAREVLKPLWAKGEMTSSLHTLAGLKKEMKYPFYMEEAGENLVFYHQNKKHEWVKSMIPMEQAKLQYGFLNTDFLDCVEKVTLLSETEEKKVLHITLAGDKIAKKLEDHLAKILPKEKNDKRLAFLLELNRDFLNHLEEDYVIDKKTKRIVKISANMTKSLQGIAYKFLDKFGDKIIVKDKELIKTIIDLSEAYLVAEGSEYDAVKKEKLPKEVLDSKEEKSAL